MVESWPWRFAYINWLAGLGFSSSCAAMMQFDWRLNAHNSLLAESLPQRLVREPQVLLALIVCVISLAWLLGFFALGTVFQDGVGVTIQEKNKKKKSLKTPTTVTDAEELSARMRSRQPPRPLRNRRRRRVAILGGTGLVGRALAAKLVRHHPTMELGFVIGSPDTAGKPFKAVWERKEAALQLRYGTHMWQAMPMPHELDDVVVRAFDDLLAFIMALEEEEGGDRANLCVISCIAPALGWMEDRLLACKVPVYSISPYARDRVPLVVPEVNFIQLQQQQPQQLLFKSPNCVSCGVCLVLDAMRKSFGQLEMVSITTFQSLSGRGDALYDADLVVGNVLPLGGTEEDTNNKIRDEVCRVLGEPELKISVTAQRVYTQRGHYVDVRLRLGRPPTAVQDVQRALEHYCPLEGWPGLPDAPRRPIRVSLEPRFPRPVQAVKDDDDDGMTVHVGHITAGTDRVFDVTLSLVVDNVARGAYGAALLTAQVHHAITTLQQQQQQQQNE